MAKENQSRAGRILQNFSFLTLGKTVGDLFTFVLFVVLSRKFGQEGIGYYSFAIGITGFFMVMADYGLGSLSIREMSRNRDKVQEYYSRVLTLRLILTVISYLLLLLVASSLSVSEQAWQVIVVVGAYQILYPILEGFGAVFIAHEKMHYTGLLEFSAKASSAILSVSVIMAGGGLVLNLTMLPLVIGVHALIAYTIVARKYGRPKLGISWREMKEMLHEASPYALFLLLYQFSTRIDVVLLGLMLGAAAAGMYNVGYRVIFMLLFLAYFGGLAVFPMASRLFAESEQAPGKLYHESLNVTLLVALPAAAGVWLIAPGLIELLFGPEFMEAVSVLRLLTVMLFFASLTSVIGTFLTACDRQTERTRCQWTSAWVNAIGNATLIPMFGIMGAAYSTVFSEGLLLILVAWRLKPLFGLPKITGRFLYATTGVLAFCIPLEYFSPLPVFVLIPLAVVIYAGVLMLFRDIRANEGKILAGLLKG